MRPRHLLPCLLAVLAAAPANAHHSPAAFDMGTTVTIEGRLADVSWRNPHVYLEVETTNADGESTIQEIEAGAVSFLVPLGVSEESLPVGEGVTVSAFPNRRGEERTALGITLTTADGVTVALNPSPLRAPSAPVARAQGLEGVWFVSTPQYFVASPVDPPLNDAGRRIMDARPRGATQAQAACTPMAPPHVMIWPVARKITLDDETAIIEVDTLSTRRVVHLDGREHPDDLAPSPLGHSVGWWEDDTLVVDTVGFDDNPFGLNFAVPSGPGKHLLERLTLAEDGTALIYEATLTDPAYLTGPVEITAQWSYRPDLELTGQPCDPESARRFLIDG